MYRLRRVLPGLPGALDARQVPLSKFDHAVEIRVETVHFQLIDYDVGYEVILRLVRIS